MSRVLRNVVLICGVVSCTAAHAAGPVLHWDFDAPLGSTEKDQTGQGFPAVLKRGHGHHPEPSRHPESGRIGGAVRIESRSFVEAAGPHPLGEAWTLSWWWRQDAVVRMGNGINLPDVSIAFPDRTPERVHLRIAGLDELRAERVTPAAWEHVALVVQPGAARLYLNGYLAAESAKADWRYPHAGGKLHFGATNWHRMYQGLLDEVKLFGTALDADAVRELALHAYHPDAQWLADFGDSMLKLIAAGRLAKHEAERYQQMGAPDVARLQAMFSAARTAQEQGAAAWALGVLRAKQALPILAKALPGAESAAAARIAEGLGLMNDPAAVPSLQQAAKHDDSDIRLAAATALTHLGEPGVAAVVDMLQRSRWLVATTAAQALQKANWEPSQDAAGAMYWAARNNWGEVTKIGPAAAPALVALLVMDDDAALLADRHQRGIVDHRRQQARATIAKLAADAEPALIGALSAPNDELKTAACELLGEVGTPASVPRLIELLETDASPVVAAAAAALSARGDPKAVPALVGVLRRHGGPARSAAVDALGAIGDDALPALIEMLASKQEAECMAAAQALGRIGSPKAVEALSRAAQGKAWKVRARAIEALGVIGDASALPVLEQALGDSDWTVRCMAAKALANLSDANARAALALAVKDDHALVRDIARRAMAGEFKVARP